MQAANSDTTITVTAQEVIDAVDETMTQIRDMFETETEYEIELKAAGFESAQHYRDYTSRRQLREMLRTNLITAMEQRGEIRNVSPTLEEMTEYYEGNVGQWQERPGPDCKPPNLVNLSDSGIARRTSASNCTSSRAVVSLASRGAAPVLKFTRVTSPLTVIDSIPIRAPKNRNSVLANSRSASTGIGPKRSRSSERNWAISLSSATRASRR